MWRFPTVIVTSGHWQTYLSSVNLTPFKSHLPHQAEKQVALHSKDVGTSVEWCGGAKIKLRQRSPMFISPVTMKHTLPVVRTKHR